MTGIGSNDYDYDYDYDYGVAGLAATVDPMTHPIGVSPALEKAKDANGDLEDWYRGYKWPPANVAQFWKNAAPTQFPRAYWNAFHYSIAVLGEFVTAQNSAGEKWDAFYGALDALLPKKKAEVDAELAKLVELIEYRGGVMAEALAQRANPWAYFRPILMADSFSAPYTRDLVEVAVRVAQFTAMHYKRAFNRPRPSQYSPALLPPIDVPGHASYPSGHATESMLIALCLEKVMPSAATTPPPPASTGNPPNPPRDASPLKQMALRIGRNREVLGLHFPSDSAAGRLLANELLDILLECPTVKNELIPKAKEEWWP